MFDGRTYLLSEAYDDAELGKLLAQASAAARVGPDAFLHDFGVFTAERTFTRLYPTYFKVAPTTREFLLSVEPLIHELVRATVPNASPPHLRVEALGDDGIAINYTSARRLCVLLRGLTEGTARYYGETTSIEEPTCMLRGDAACMFFIRFRPASPPA